MTISNSWDDAWPLTTHGEPVPQPMVDWPPDPPEEVTFDIEDYSENDDEPIRRALWAGGWSTDKVTVLGRLVGTCQGPGLYYAGVLIPVIPVNKERWRLRLTLVEDRP